MRRTVAVVVLVVLLIAGATIGIVVGIGNGGPTARGPLPAVSTAFGHTPVITFPSNAPPNKLMAKVLHEGTGRVIARGNLVIANYVGQIWQGKVFDTTFDARVPDAFQVGEKRVIAGWDKTLVGMRVGSRVLLVVPPVDGYGKLGLSQEGITASTTIIYVMDLLGTYGPNIGLGIHAVVLRHGADGVRVIGAPGEKPTITFAKKAVAPKTTLTVLLARGNGPLLEPGFVVIQGVEQAWGGGVIDSTWANKTPAASPVGIPGDSSLLDSLVGTPLGSRVLIISPQKTNATPAEVGVIDLVAEPKDTAAQSR